MATLEIKNNKAKITFEVPKYMEDQYDLYIQEVLEDGAYIVNDVKETENNDLIVGSIDIEFHEDMYNAEVNNDFMKGIKANLTFLEKGIKLYETVRI